MAIGDPTAAETTAAATTPAATTTDATAPQQTGTESSLSSWVGDYVTDMLGKGQALGSTDYQGYGGPLTAGASAAQDAAFQGIAGLTLPTDQMGAFTPGSFTDAGIASQYMNPYLMQALQPQIDEARRQAGITATQNANKFAGAYGGSAQALYNAEADRNLGQNLSAITGTGYANAFDKAQQQFNTEQGRGQTAQDAANTYGLAALTKQADLGAAQRSIESEGIKADRLQFEEERDFPYKQVQYMQSLLQGLPLATQSYSYAEPSSITAALNAAGGVKNLYDSIFG